MRTRTIQSHTFVGQDTKTVTKEIISVLQDEGFMVKTVSGELGVLTAERDTNIEKFGSKFFAYLFSGRNARWKKHSVVEVTSNIVDEGEKTRVRLNFLVRVFDNLGRVIDVHQILDEEMYEDFFVKIQRGLHSKIN